MVSKVRQSKATSASNHDSKQQQDVSSNLGPMQEAARALKNSESAGQIREPTNPFELARSVQSKIKKALASQIPVNIPLRIESDCPDGVIIDQFTWSKLQELRSARIEKEIATKKLSIEYTAVKQQFDFLKNEEQHLDRKVTQKRDTRDVLRRKIDDFDCNLEVLVSLRQGQDEVDADAMVSDYSDAVLMPIQVVRAFNERIRELGKDKISVLAKIKMFRRKINLIDWEASHLQLLKQYFDEYFTDLQLLRVTKDLQQVIREGSDAEVIKARTEKIGSRKEFLQKDAEMKLSKLLKSKDSILKQLEERTEETTRLEGKLQGLQTQVSSRKLIKQSRDFAKGGEDNSSAINLATKKLKSIMSRRQLVDTARAQAEEIDFLRQELDKLRQKTFPSFVRATKKRMSSGV